MDVESKPAVRPPTKRLLIEQSLRRDIIEGRVRPGGRMPSWIESRRFGTGPLTIQQAVDRLRNDGFLVARGSRGTFAAENLPHLSRYALVFFDHPSRSRFLTSLWKEAAEVGRDDNRKIEVYDQVADHVDNENFQRLASAVRGERLAGLIFAHSPHTVANSILLQGSPELPRVAVTRRGAMPNLSAVELEYDSYLDPALDYFASRGRKRVAALAFGDYFAGIGEPLSRGAAARGMVSRHYWQQMPSLGCPASIRACMQLLMNENQIERPDAILLADDNLVEHATAALHDMGLRSPQDLDVVAHCNFPWAAPNFLPVKWIGFDARQILEAAVRLIDQQRLDGIQRIGVGLPAVMRDDPTASSVQ